MPDRDSRATMSFRAWGRTKKRLEELGKAEKFAHTTLIGDTAEILAGAIHCSRCGETIPATMGDCTGRPLRDWVIDATSAVYGQRCKDHHPVLVGAETAPASPVSSVTGRQGSDEEGDAGVGTEPPAPVPAQRRKKPPKRNGGAAAAAAVDRALEQMDLDSEGVPYPDSLMSCPCGKGDYEACTDCPYDQCSVHGWEAAREVENRLLRKPASPLAAESTPAATAARLAADIPGVTTASELPSPRPGTLAFKPPVDEPHLPPVHEVPAVPQRAKQGLTTPHAVTCKCGICKPAKGGKR